MGLYDKLNLSGGVIMSNPKREDGSPMKDGINNNTYNLLFGDFTNLPEEEQGSYENVIAYATIDRFTKLQEKKIFTKLLKLLYKNTIIDLDKITFNEKTKQYEYKNNDLIITFDKLSNCFDDKDLIKELTSNKRYGECHSRAMSISPVIEGSRIVTGYITIGNKKVLHSVIEYEYNDKTIVLDWTRNLKITKEQYIELTKFVELSSFEGRQVIDDIEIIFGNLNIGCKPYVVFRDELIRDMQKNPHFLKPTEKGKNITQAFRDEEERLKNEENKCDSYDNNIRKSK